MAVSISKFADMAFCELKLVHSIIDGARPQFRPCVMLGTKNHAMAAEEDARKPYKRLSGRELLEGLRDETSSFELPSESVRVRFEHGGSVFAGRLDKLVKQEKKVMVVDLKFTGKAGGVFKEKYECQLLSYCKALRDGEVKFKGGVGGREMFKGLDLYYVLMEMDIMSRKLLVESRPVKFDETRLLPKLRKFEAIMRGDFTRGELACGEPEKCERCEFGHLCAYRA